MAISASDDQANSCGSKNRQCLHINTATRPRRIIYRDLQELCRTIGFFSLTDNNSFTTTDFLAIAFTSPSRDRLDKAEEASEMLELIVFSFL